MKPIFYTSSITFDSRQHRCLCFQGDKLFFAIVSTLDAVKELKYLKNYPFDKNRQSTIWQVYDSEETDITFFFAIDFILNAVKEIAFY